MKIRGYVQDAGGGTVTVVVDRETPEYPPIGAPVELDQILRNMRKWVGAGYSITRDRWEDGEGNPLDMDDRNIWIPEYNVEHRDVTEIVSDGDDWPIVWAEKWEHNGIGERRFIERRQYRIEPRDDTAV